LWQVVRAINPSFTQQGVVYLFNKGGECIGNVGEVLNLADVCDKWCVQLIQVLRNKVSFIFLKRVGSGNVGEV
jgi:hypothetical protein